MRTLMLIFLLLCGCTSGPCWIRPTPEFVTEQSLKDLPPEVAEALLELPVYLWRGLGGGGSAIPVRPDLVLLSRHQLRVQPEHVLAPDGVRALRVVAQGEGKLADWAYVAVHPPLNVEAPAFDFDRALEPGETVYLVGYWGNYYKADGQRRTVIAAPLTDPQIVLTDDARHVLCNPRLRIPCFYGVSGGAAVLWDQLERRLVVIGVYTGGGAHLFGSRRLRPYQAFYRPPTVPAAPLELDGWPPEVPLIEAGPDTMLPVISR